MSTCLLCDGPIDESAPVSKEVRGLLSPRGKMAKMDMTGRVAHWGCVKAMVEKGITWKEQRIVPEEG